MNTHTSAHNEPDHFYNRDNPDPTSPETRTLYIVTVSHHGVVLAEGACLRFKDAVATARQLADTYAQTLAQPDAPAPRIRADIDTYRCERQRPADFAQRIAGASAVNPN